MNKVQVAPSILAADFSRLGEEVEMLERIGADMVHFDVMDGVFVPPITFGADMVKALKKRTSLKMDAHLMVCDAASQVEQFIAAGADSISVHYEGTTHLQRILALLRKNNVGAAVALNPATPVHMLEDVLCDVDMVLIMSVNPGYGGQGYIPQITEKIRKLDAMRKSGGYNFTIQVDGGVNLKNAGQIVEAGADILVAGSAVFGAENPEEVVKKLQQLR